MCVCLPVCMCAKVYMQKRDCELADTPAGTGCQRTSSNDRGFQIKRNANCTPKTLDIFPFFLMDLIVAEEEMFFLFVYTFF